MWAAKEGHLAICELLVGRGADIDSTDKVSTYTIDNIAPSNSILFQNKFLYCYYIMIIPQYSNAIL